MKRPILTILIALVLGLGPAGARTAAEEARQSGHVVEIGLQILHLAGETRCGSFIAIREASRVPMRLDGPQAAPAVSALTQLAADLLIEWLTNIDGTGRLK